MVYHLNTINKNDYKFGPLMIKIFTEDEMGKGLDQISEEAKSDIVIIDITVSLDADGDALYVVSWCAASPKGRLEELFDKMKGMIQYAGLSKSMSFDDVIKELIIHTQELKKAENRVDRAIEIAKIKMLIQDINNRISILEEIKGRDLQ